MLSSGVACVWDCAPLCISLAKRPLHPLSTCSGGIVRRRARRGRAGTLGFRPRLHRLSNRTRHNIKSLRNNREIHKRSRRGNKRIHFKSHRASERVGVLLCLALWCLWVFVCFACSCVGIKHSGLCTDSSRFLPTQTLDSCRAFFFFTSPSLPPFASLLLLAFLFLSGILKENAANTIKLFMSDFGQPNVLIITSWRNFLYCAC